MKKHLLSLAVIALAIVLAAACKEKPAENPEPVKPASITAEHFTAFLVTEPEKAQAFLDSMGIKKLNYFFEEGGPGAQCDNEQSYYGRGAVVELTEDGGTSKITPEDEHAVVIHVGGEGTVNGYFAFRSEEDYNNFISKLPKIDEETQEAPWLEVEPKGNGDANDWLWDSGFEKGKWYIAEFMLRE
jgi:hypothetical protein